MFFKHFECILSVAQTDESVLKVFNQWRRNGVAATPLPALGRQMVIRITKMVILCIKKYDSDYKLIKG